MGLLEMQPMRGHTRPTMQAMIREDARVCRTCGELRPISEFSVSRNYKTGKSWHRRRCRACDAIYGRSWRVANPFAHRRSVLKRLYNIELEEYERLYDAQGGGCAICGQPERSKITGLLVVDHNHDTKKVRGLLCTNCNIAIGHLRDDPNVLRAAALYLERGGIGDGSGPD